MSRAFLFNFAGWEARVLHRSPALCADIADRLGVLGVRAEGRWPALDPADTTADLVIVDVDQGHDGQFPWTSGAAPMPVVALIGSESPGRLSWALSQRADAFLPLAAIGNLYPALVVAAASFHRRREDAERAAELARRNAKRLSVIRAVTAIMQAEGVDEARGLKRLRALAMVERLSLEDAAETYLAERGAPGAAQA